MKHITTALALTTLTFLLGCSSMDKSVFDTTPRKPTTSVDVYKDEKMPTRQYKEIGEVTYVAKREKELQAQRSFITEARKMGGNGIIMSVTPAGIRESGSMYGFNTSEVWLFKSKVIVYE